MNQLHLTARAYSCTLWVVWRDGPRLDILDQVIGSGRHLPRSGAAVHADLPGIPVGEQDTIFRRFYRLPTSGGGSGLGLEIARSIVELHGGRLWVESAPGRGATFHVALPRHEQEGQP